MLTSLKVIEVGNFISAPFATSLMADLGADVTKIEAPEGDPLRTFGPSIDPESQLSGLFLSINHRKKLVRIDLQTATGRDVFLKLVSTADMLVENHGETHWKKIGLPWEDIAAANRRIRIVSLTPYGNNGPYKNFKGNDININAIAGIADCIGSPQKNPLNLPFHQALFSQGVSGAAAAVLAMLFEPDENDKPILVDVSASDVMASYIATLNLVHTSLGIKMKREGQRASGSGGAYPMTILHGKEGPIVIVCAGGQYKFLVEAMGSPEWSSDPRFQSHFELWRYADELDEHIEAWLSTLSHKEVEKIAVDYDIPMYPVRNIDEVMEDEQYRFRKFFNTLTYGGKEYKIPGLPFSWSNGVAPDDRASTRRCESDATKSSPQPLSVKQASHSDEPFPVRNLRIGRDNEAILCGLGYAS